MKKSIYEIMEDSIYETIHAKGIVGLDHHEEIVRIDSELTKLATLTSNFSLFGHIPEEKAILLINHISEAKMKLAGK
ncbi:MAG: hypothetical protein JEY99_19880 [Spirochaetales bacterium]|nr:hypothetical protein [Spirochaetales bacterium]